MSHLSKIPNKVHKKVSYDTKIHVILKFDDI